ncbi:MAG: hypothetical protein ACREXR_18105 [Gammaproteobacteria bacterium]
MLERLNSLAAAVGVFGAVVLFAAIFFYLARRSRTASITDQSHPHRTLFILGFTLVGLSWLTKVVIVLIDPSISVLGPSLMWDRMSRESGFYDDSFYRR